MSRNAIIVAGILLAGCQTSERAMTVAKANQIIQNLANNTKCQEAFEAMPIRIQDILAHNIETWHSNDRPAIDLADQIGLQKRRAAMPSQIIATAPTACSE